MKNEKIDFVLIWVDSNDEQWQKEKAKYEENNKNIDNRNIRYRDWDNLKYWFRAVEKYASWVNKIHFVTCGHLPKWLNIEHPKLNIVKHSDYIPKEYLPTFSANPIELNLHRIKDLEEKFVYFNDDTFLNNYVKKEDFFKKGLPCETAVLNTIIPDKTTIFPHILLNGIEIINSNFKMKECIKKNRFKWYNLKYGIGLYRNIILKAWPNFPGIKYFHLPTSFLKSTFEEVWKKESEVLEKTSKNKFRNKEDVNQYLIKDWQLASGKFYPRRINFGKFYTISDDNKDILNDIEKGKHKMICINDSEKITDFDKQKEIINLAFEKRLSKKSSFEK